MLTYQVCLGFFCLLLCFKQVFPDTSDQNRFCRGDKPVVQICTDDMRNVSTTVHIDTNNVPTYQENNCKCEIDLHFSQSTNKLYYEYVGSVPRDMTFKIGRVILEDSAEDDEDSREYGTIDLVNQKKILSLHTPVHYTNGGTCLEIFIKNLNFTITCTKVEISRTKSSTLTSPRQPETSTGQKTTRKTHVLETTTSKEINTTSDTEMEKETGNEMITIVAVVVPTGFVCCMILVFIYICCKRRSKSNRHTVKPRSDAAKEDENNYYMTENPMYEASETPKVFRNSDHAYHYIDHTTYNGIRTSQYESAPESPNSKQSSTAMADKEKHYDYTTCLSASEKAMPNVENKGSFTEANGNILCVTKPQIDDENMYDVTNKAEAKKFQGLNVYHQLSPVGSLMKPIVDTYHTIKNTSNAKQVKDDENEDAENLVYHVANNNANY